VPAEGTPTSEGADTVKLARVLFGVGAFSESKCGQHKLIRPLEAQIERAGAPVWFRIYGSDDRVLFDGSASCTEKADLELTGWPTSFVPVEVSGTINVLTHYCPVEPLRRSCKLLLRFIL